MYLPGVLKFSLLLVASVPASAQQTRFIFNFGDSYSSTFFNPYNTTSPPKPQNPTGNPPYPGQTTAGGANWIDVLTKSLSPAGTLNWNYAYFGATVDRQIAPPYALQVQTFGDQLAEFKGSVGSIAKPAYARWTPTNSVFLAWFGLNDIRSTTNFQGDLDSYVARLQDLYAAGARRFVLVLVPPAQRTPLYVNSAQAGSLQNAVANWNSQLRAHGAAFAKAHGDARVAYYDPTATFNNILDHPTQYGAPDNTCYNANGLSCLWWDNFHPGQRIHQALASGIRATFASLGFYSS